MSWEANICNLSLNTGPDSFLLSSDDLIGLLGLSIFKIRICGQKLGLIFSSFTDTQNEHVYLSLSLRLLSQATEVSSA